MASENGDHSCASFQDLCSVLGLGGGVEGASDTVSLRPSVEEVRTAIVDRGPAKVLAELHAEPQKWATVYRGIASGSRPWMDVGRDLATAADAGWAYSIDLAFGEAMAVAPSLVLRMAPG